MRARTGVVVAAMAGASLSARRAAASNALESPEAGTAHIGRGGAWLARADDPLAAYFNPAALATQPSGAHVGAQLLIKKHCMDRRDDRGERLAPAPGFNPPPDEVCADIAPLPNPQFGLAVRAHRHVAIGIAVLAPHALPGIVWPATVEYANASGAKVPHPSPTRYMLLETKALGAFPTIAVGAAITPQLQLGAGFVWGLSSFELTSMIEGASTQSSPTGPEPDDFGTDIRATVNGFDGFIPGFVASALWSPHRRFDIAGWYRFSDSIKSKLDLRTEAPFYSTQGLENPSPAVTEVADAGSFRLPIPMEAKLGFRYRHPREGAQSQRWLTQHGDWARDSLSQDVFDVELDATWANNAQIDTVEIRVKPSTFVNLGGIQALVPENGDTPHHYKHVLGVRLGGEYVPIADLLAVRAGLFFESPGQDAEDLYVDFHQGWRLGGGGGVTLRFDRFDISVAYQHTHFGELDNQGRGATKGLSGDQTRPDGRTIQTVNGGSTTASLNEVALGLGVHW